MFVKTAIETLLHEGAIGLFLTSLMILMFLGSMRATVAVFFSIPLSALATFIVLALGGGSINSMVLGGLALAFSRLIDNSVVVLENIYRHLELGETPEVAAEKGGREVALPVLASTLTTAVVFFPVTFLYGVSKFLFSALALAVVILAGRLLRRGDDRRAAVLRPVHFSPLHEGGAGLEEGGGKPHPAAGSTTGSTALRTIPSALRPDGQPGSGPPSAPWPASLSPCWPLLP